MSIVHFGSFRQTEQSSDIVGNVLAKAVTNELEYEQKQRE